MTVRWFPSAGRIAAAALLTVLAGGAAPPVAARDELYLIGEDWVGRWKGDKIAASTALGQISAAVPDGAGGVWVLAYPRNAANDQAGDAALLARRDARTLALMPMPAQAKKPADVVAVWPSSPGRVLLVRAQVRTAQVADAGATDLKLESPWRAVATDAVVPRIRAGRWLAPAPSLVGVDTDAAIDPSTIIDAKTLETGPGVPWAKDGAVLAFSRNAALVVAAPGQVRVLALADGKVISERTVRVREASHLRGALSPDGGTAAVFVRPASGDRWTGVAWDVASARTLPLADFFIDTGAARENGAARSLACLLPSGKGAIFTLVGPPADRVSQAVLADRNGSRTSDLRTAYVKACMLG